MIQSLHDGLFGHVELSQMLSARFDVKTMLAVEGALAATLAKHEIIPKKSAQAIAIALSRFEPNLQELASATIRDGVAVPELVRQVRESLKGEIKTHFHFGATSQDIVDTARSLRVAECLSLIAKDLDYCLGMIGDLEGRFETSNLMGQTRMQAALPLTVVDKLDSWKRPLNAHAGTLHRHSNRWTPLVFGGAVGTLHAYEDKGALVAETLAEKLGLYNPGSSLHSQRHFVASLGGWLSMVSGHLGKIGQDICLMAQNERSDIKLSGGGGSSAMPHKQNPIFAESLITLARFNAVQISGLHQSLIHENERSGSAWALEWMVLPQMIVATGAAIRNATGLLGQIEEIGNSK